MLLLAIFTVCLTAKTLRSNGGCKQKLDTCKTKGRNGICDAQNVCRTKFRDVSFQGFTDDDFKKLAPLLVNEAVKWNAAKNKRYFLDAKQVKTILSKVIEQQNDATWWSKPLVYLDVPESGKIVLVGDTHGQLRDVLWIFFEHGLPSLDNIYLFNGDICDRGDDATTIWLILLVYKLSNAKIIHINRGNHENEAQNFYDGFHDEVTKKFPPPSGKSIYGQFQQIFNTLPLYTIIHNELFVVHAGLPRVNEGNVTVKYLESVNHKGEIPEPNSDNDKIFMDATWADPQDEDGIYVNLDGEGRGVGTSTFGPDVTRRFLESTKLKKVFRSHQPGDDLRWPGLQAFHESQGITVFSASNYYQDPGDTGNRGAVVLLRPGKHTLDIMVSQHYIRNDNDGVTSRIWSPARIWARMKIFFSKKEVSLNDFESVKNPLMKAEVTLESFLKDPYSQRKG